MKYDLEERLIKFACATLQIVEALPKRDPCQHLGNQLARSGTAPALNYGEAQGAESRADFIHKMKVGLKELRETSICLRIIDLQNYVHPNDKVHAAIRENTELISIFVASVKTATSRKHS